MGLFDWLFPPRRPGEVDTTGVVRGKAAEAQPKIMLAKGRGFTFEVVGEAHYQDEIDKVAGGKGERGHKLETVAQLVFINDNKHDANAVGVMIDAEPVGFVPRTEAKAIRDEILAINPQMLPVICYGKIVGGWRDDDGEGHYGVKLSLARPLRPA